MEDEAKTKKQLIEELGALRQAVATLQGFKDEVKQTRADLEKFTNTFLQNSIPMFITTLKEGIFVDVNDAFLKLVELKRDEVLGRTATEAGFIKEEQRTLFHNELGKHGRVENFEIEIRPKSIGDRFGLFNIVMMSFNNESYLLTTIQDITSRKLAEYQLKELERKFQTIADFTYDWENWIGVDGNPIWISPSVERISGYSVSECMTMPEFPLPMIYPEDRGKFLAKIQYVQEWPLNDMEFRIIKKDGTIIWISVSANPVLIEASISAGHRSSIRDITHRKRMEEALRESEENYSQLFNNSFDAIAVFGNTPPQIRFVNSAFIRLFGYTSEEIFTFPEDDIFLLVFPDDREMVKNYLRARHRQESVPGQYESRIITKNGEIRWVEVSAASFYKGDEYFSQAIYHDITDRKRAEEVLVKSEEKYRLITENITDCITLIDDHGIIQYVTNSLDTLGYKPEEVIGIPGLSFTHSDDVERMGRFYREGVVDQVWRKSDFELRLRHKDGHYVPMDVSARILGDSQGLFTGGVFWARPITQHGKIEDDLLRIPQLPFVDRRLTLRENEVLKWIMQGKSTWDISKIINLSEGTVKFHVEKVLKKLSAVNRAHAVSIAMQK